MQNNGNGFWLMLILVAILGGAGAVVNVLLFGAAFLVILAIYWRWQQARFDREWKNLAENQRQAAKEARDPAYKYVPR